MNEYPLTLPGPSKVVLKPAERRRASTITEGLQQVLGRQRDFLGIEEVEWEFVAADAEIFDAWWKGEIVYGGGWFAAAWPSSHRMAIGNRRFITVPKWTLIGHEYWRVSAQLELRSGTLNDSPSGGAVGMEPGGTRIYEMLLYTQPTPNPKTLPHPALSEISQGWYFRATMAETGLAVAAGPLVTFVFTCATADTVNFAAPVIASVSSTTTREAYLLDSGSSSGLFRSIEANMPGFFYSGQTVQVRILIDGADIGRVFLLTLDPDEGTPSGSGIITGYPGGRYDNSTYSWGIS